jgi:hypothetical protein
MAVTVRWWKQMNFYDSVENKRGAKLFVATIVYLGAGIAQSV